MERSKASLGPSKAALCLLRPTFSTGVLGPLGEEMVAQMLWSLWEFSVTPLNTSHCRRNQSCLLRSSYCVEPGPPGSWLCQGYGHVCCYRLRWGNEITPKQWWRTGGNKKVCYEYPWNGAVSYELLVCSHGKQLPVPDSCYRISGPQEEAEDQGRGLTYPKCRLTSTQGRKEHHAYWLRMARNRLILFSPPLAQSLSILI